MKTKEEWKNKISEATYFEDSCDSSIEMDVLIDEIMQLQETVSKQTEEIDEVRMTFVRQIKHHIIELNALMGVFLTYKTSWDERVKDEPEVRKHIRRPYWAYGYCREVKDITDPGWAYWYCRKVKDRSEVRKHITDSFWAYCYCKYVKDRPEVRKYITDSRWAHHYCKLVKDRPDVRKHIKDESCGEIQPGKNHTFDINISSRNFKGVYIELGGSHVDMKKINKKI